MTNFYIINHDIGIDRWVLSLNIPGLPEMYRQHQNGVRWDVSEVEVGIYAEGPTVDFFMIIKNPLVSRRVGEFLDKYAPGEVERIPVRFQSYHGDFEFIHILWEVDCLDRGKSEISPDGMIWKLVMHSQKLQGRQFFRLVRDTRIIVTRELKEAFEKEGFTGAIFEPAETS